MGEYHLQKCPINVSFEIFGSKLVIFFSHVSSDVLNIHQFFQKFQKPYLLFKIENIRNLTRNTFMVFIKDFCKDFTNPRTLAREPPDANPIFKIRGYR